MKLREMSDFRCNFLTNGRWRKVILFILIIWIFGIFMGSWSFLCINFSSNKVWDVKPVKENLDVALRRLSIVEKQNEELKKLFSGISFKDLSRNEKSAFLKEIDENVNIKDYILSSESFVMEDWKIGIGQKDNSSLEYESLRRRIGVNIQEFWNFVHSEVEKAQQIAKSDSGVTKVLQNILSLGIEHKRSLLNDLEMLKEADGYEKWRTFEASELSDLVQRRLYFLQNPENCAIARKAICNLDLYCGLGCQLHHIVYCFILAYATERTLILKSKNWVYNKEGGWEEIYLPISDSCTSFEGKTKSVWPGTTKTQVIIIPNMVSLRERPSYLPMKIPSDIAPRLKKLHGAPFAWFSGQFLKYLLRPQPKTSEFLESSAKKLGFKKPIVGVHVRRTDKIISEAILHRIEEYMIHVEEYYNQLEMIKKVDKRRVYLATDEPKVLAEAKEKYPNYEILGDTKNAEMSSVGARYTKEALYGITLDIYFLSLSDYLVCTFSSSVCRTAYEIMQSMHVDASDRFKSLDDIYYYDHMDPHYRIAIMDHDPKGNHSELKLEVGDVVSIAGNHWDGYSKGIHKRTKKTGLFPGFKTIDMVDVADFPKYSNVSFLNPFVSKRV